MSEKAMDVKSNYEDATAITRVGGVFRKGKPCKYEQFFGPLRICGNAV